MGELSELEEMLKINQSELTLDKKGRNHLDRHMEQIEKERNYLRDMNAASMSFVNSMASEDELGFVMKEYGKMEDGLQSAYHKMRGSHAKAMEMLKRDFDYHPAYKRGYVRKWTATDEHGVS